MCVASHLSEMDRKLRLAKCETFGSNAFLQFMTNDEYENSKTTCNLLNALFIAVLTEYSYE